MTQVNCLCAQICLPLICGGNGGFDGINGDVFCERCDGGGGGGGGGVVGGGRAGSIGLNQCIAFTWCINCLFFLHLSSIGLSEGILLKVGWGWSKYQKKVPMGKITK